MYGYVLIDEEKNQYIIFSLTNSMYPAMEIYTYPTADRKHIDALKKKYGEMGYAVRICDKIKYEDLENYLFNLFFQVKETNKRSLGRYNDYVNSIMESYGTSHDVTHYKYVEVPFELEENFSSISVPTDIVLVDSIIQHLEQKGPQFIIIEACAGFGKTSTAYEVLHKYAMTGYRPFLMELARDRIAPTFQYLLVNQIDKEFSVKLSSELVIYNIRNGNIPLIIDGFDELLSKDLDNGSTNNISSSKINRMLSTIAELLTDNAKIILTTRKTAIFSGESFYNWYIRYLDNGREFNIARYQLGNPSISDWLPKERIKLLPKTMKSIANPVLLGYMRYLSDEKYKEVVEADSLTSNYFNMLLRREIQRQNLPITIEEQKIVLRRLAAYYAAIDATVMSRQEVKGTIMELSQEQIVDNNLSYEQAKNLSNSLTNHAFLDRKNDNNDIGFLNDFIYGTFLMMAIADEETKIEEFYFGEIAYRSLEKAIFSAADWGEIYREKFWNTFIERCKPNQTLLFWADMMLKRENKHSFEELSFEEHTITGALLGTTKFSIQNCSFSNIRFINCSFDFNFIQRCTFIKCVFDDCIKDGNNISCGFYGCETPIDFIDTSDLLINDIERETLSEDEMYMAILRKYLHVNERTRKMKMISKLKDEYMEYQWFKKIFNSLVSQNYILTNGDKSFISSKGMEYFNSHKNIL